MSRLKLLAAGASLIGAYHAGEIASFTPPEAAGD
jgi:hypothetical protein